MPDRFAGFRYADAGGVPVLWAPDDRFKSLRVLMQARRPLDERAAARSLLPSLLLHGTQRDPDRPSIARRMEELYLTALSEAGFRAQSLGKPNKVSDGEASR